MKLRYIALWINYFHDSGVNDKFKDKFSYNTSFVNNYLSRQVRKCKIETGDWNMISVELSKNVDADCAKLSLVFKSVDVILKTTDEELKMYSMMPKSEQCEFYLQKLEQGYELARSVCDFDTSMLYTLHNQFRSQGCKNEWLFKKKTLKDYGILVSLDCSLSYAEFNLFLSVYNMKTKDLIARKSVFRTFPDEIFFAKQIRKASFGTNKLVILDFLERPECVFHYRDLAKGNIIVNILDEDDAKYQYNEANKDEFEWIRQ